MNLLKPYIIIACFLITSSCYAQLHKDTVKSLALIEVTSSRLVNFSIGTKIYSIDSNIINQYKSGNLATLLENESQLFIKSYGIGNLATPSFRGSGASHTAILWNNFNLNSPLTGQLDLSLLPNNFINNINIQYGGTSTLWGSGAVGGAIHLNNELKFAKGITVMLGNSIGSFSNYEQNMLVEISKLRWATSIKFFNKTAENNFEYINTQLINSPKVKQNNSELKQQGLFVDNYFQINKHQKINFRFWFQNNARNIPPTMLQSFIKSNQKDDCYRLTSEWQRVNNKISYFARIAYFDENLKYTVYDHNYHSFNRSKTIIAETEAKVKLNKNILLNIGINNTYIKALASDFINKPEQNRTALFTSCRFNSLNNVFLATLSARQEIIGNNIIPFTYSFGTELKLLKHISFSGNVSKVYRVPTIIDLFWMPGGNLNLLPESGFSEELGALLKLNSSNEKIKFLFEPTIFNRKIYNWILWLPGQSYWSPQNIMEVWSRGLETRSEFSIYFNNLKFKINLLTNYVISTNEKAKTENDASINKQLIYVPMYSGNAKISLEYKKISFTINQNYTGYRYTATDNSEYLKPYMLTNSYVSYTILLKNYNLNLFVALNNILNVQYQVMLNRAMPLRNYQTGILIKFNTPNKINKNEN